MFAFLYGMFRIPFLDFGIVRMQPINIVDIFYITVASTLIGVMFALFQYKSSIVPISSKGTGIGSFGAGFFGALCPACQTISVAAAGSTIFALPLAFLVPYVNVIRLLSILLLVSSLYFITNTLYIKTCPLPRTSISGNKKSENETETSFDIFSFLQNKLVLSILIVLVIVTVFNQFLTTSAFAALVSSSSGGTVSISSGSLKLEYGPKTTLKPMPLAVGEQPTIAGYKTKVKSLPTISELSVSSSTGDLAQDLLNNVIPRGTPWYGQEAGVSFDDPITAQKLWAKGRAIQLDATNEERWKRIVNSFTCDYCCGSPQNPTIITKCGCAHSAAAQGMAKWFIKTYGDKFSDEEIYGELARWYAVWYPGPTIKRIMQEASV